MISITKTIPKFIAEDALIFCDMNNMAYTRFDDKYIISGSKENIQKLLIHIEYLSNRPEKKNVFKKFIDFFIA